MRGILAINTIDDKKNLAQIFAHPTRMGLKRDEICEKFKVSPPTLYKYLRDEEVQKFMKEYRANTVKIELPNIDAGLVKRASKGDVKAAELIYERWDDYQPGKSGHMTNIQINFKQKEVDER